MKRGLKLVVLSYKTETQIVSMPGWYCSHCVEGIHSPEDMEVSDRLLAEMKARADNILRPEEIRRIRLQLGLTQRDAGQLVGGGVNAFQKYESGEILPSRGLSNLLRILERHPSELSQIKDENYRQSHNIINIIGSGGEGADFPASETVRFADNRQDWGQDVHPIENSAWLHGTCVKPSVIVALGG